MYFGPVLTGEEDFVDRMASRDLCREEPWTDIPCQRDPHAVQSVRPTSYPVDHLQQPPPPRMRSHAISTHFRSVALQLFPVPIWQADVTSASDNDDLLLKPSTAKWNFDTKPAQSASRVERKPHKGKG